MNKKLEEISKSVGYFTTTIGCRLHSIDIKISESACWLLFNNLIPYIGVCCPKCGEEIYIRKYMIPINYLEKLKRR